MMKQYWTILILTISGISGAIGQDTRYSQSSGFPLLLNPAYTGLENDLSISTTYRSQWKSALTPFQGGGASLNMKIPQKNHKLKRGFLGAGAVFNHAESGIPTMSTDQFFLSLSGGIPTGEHGTIAGGIYGGIRQRRTAPAEGKWASQYDGTQYNESLPSGERFETDKVQHLDLGAGIIYHYLNSNGQSRLIDLTSDRFTAGLASYHANRPTQTFQILGEEKLYRKWNAFLQGTKKIKGSDYSLTPSLLFSQQGPHQEIVGSIMGRMLIKKGKSLEWSSQYFVLSAGIGYRVKDAVIARAQMDWKHFSLGFSYDINTSSLSSQTNNRGALEVMLRYHLGEIGK